MRRTRVLGSLAPILICLVGEAWGGIPCAAYSTSVLTLQRADGAGLPCGQCDLVWAPSGTQERILIRVTVRDCLEQPLAACTVRLDLAGSFDVNNDLTYNYTGRICGAPSRTAVTAVCGCATFEIMGGGSGKMALNWVVTALCADPPVELANNWDTLCVKSPDFNGTGIVNFQDTFLFVPKLVVGTGYSRDFRTCSSSNTVNFQDTMFYMPFVAAGAACPGGTSFTLTTVTTMGDDCDQLFN